MKQKINKNYNPTLRFTTNKKGETIPAFAQPQDYFRCAMGAMSGNAVKLYIDLYFRINKTRKDNIAPNECFPSALTIEQETGLDGNALYEATLELAKHGFLYVRYEGKRADGKKNVNHYFVNDVPKIDETNIAIIESRKWSRKEESAEDKVTRKLAGLSAEEKEFLIGKLIEKNVAQAEKEYETISEPESYIWPKSKMKVEIQETADWDLE